MVKFSSELADEELVELCQARGARDDRPFQELFHRHQKMVWHVCYGFFRNGQDAEDMTQEVFLRAYRALPKFEARAMFKTWIYRIAVNTSQNELRRRSRRPQSTKTDIGDMAEYLPGSPGVEQQLQRNLQTERLTRAMAELRPPEFDVLYLKDVEERPYQEIADKFDIGLSAAKMRVQRARLALQVAYTLQEELEVDTNE